MRSIFTKKGFYLACGRAAVETLRGLLWEQQVSFRRSSLNGTFYLSLALFLSFYAFATLVPLLFHIAATSDIFGDYTVLVQLILLDIDWSGLENFVNRLFGVTIITFIFAVLEALYTFVEILRREIRELDLLDPLSGRQEVLAWLILVSSIFFLVPLVAVILNEFTIGKHGFDLIQLRFQNIRPLGHWDLLDWSLFLGFRFPCWLFLSSIFLLDPLVESFLRTSFWRSFVTMNNRKEGIVWVFFLALMFCLLFLAAFITNLLTVGVSYEKIYLRLEHPSLEHLFSPDILDVGFVLLGFFVPLGFFLFLIDPIIEFIINKAPLKSIRRIGFISILGGMLYIYFYQYEDLYSLLLWIARRAIELRFSGEYNNLSDLSAHKTFMELFTYSPFNFQVEMGTRITEGVVHHVSDGDGIFITFQTGLNYVSSCSDLNKFLCYPLFLTFLIRSIQLKFPNLSFIIKFIVYFFLAHSFVFIYLASAPRGLVIEDQFYTVWNPFLVHLIMIISFTFTMLISNRFSSWWQLCAFLLFPAIELFFLNVTYQELLNRNHFLLPYILPNSWFLFLNTAITAQADPLVLYESCRQTLYEGMIAFSMLLIFAFLDSLAPLEKDDEKSWLPMSAIYFRVLFAGLIFVSLILLMDDFSNYWITKDHWVDLSAEEVIKLKANYLKIKDDEQYFLEILENRLQFSLYKPTLVTTSVPIDGCLYKWFLFGYLLSVPIYSLFVIIGLFFVKDFKNWVLAKKVFVYLLHLDVIIAIVYPFCSVFHLFPSWF